MSLYRNLHIHFVWMGVWIRGRTNSNYCIILKYTTVNTMCMRVTSFILKHIFIVETVHMHVVPFIRNGTHMKKKKYMGEAHTATL